MTRTRIPHRVPRLLVAAWAVALLVAVVLVPARAFAAGTFVLKSKEAQEVSGAWHIYVSINLPKAPSVPHQTMRFLFTKTMVYERTLVDGKNEPQNTKIAMQNQTPSIESLDVGFSDARGKIFAGTTFDFGLARTRGYEAGEYKVELRTSDGQTIGSPQTLTLKGDNPVVDRRAIAFNAKDPSIKKIEGHDAGAKVAKNDDPPPGDTPAGNGEVTATGNAQPFIPPDAYNKTPEENIQVKPKSGCGCLVVGGSGDLALGLGSAAAVGLLILARRKRDRA